MTRQDLGNATTTMYAEGAELVIERTFDAPREQVWAVMTSPEHIPQWWGPHGTTTDVVEMDVRPGGRWRWVNLFDGGRAPFTGEYLEVVPPQRFVRTSIFDIEPFNTGPGAIETATFDEVEGGTKVTYHTRFPAQEAIDAALAQGMSKGALEQFDRLADLLTGTSRPR
ncbi:SRPBCC domain-containing protein [Rhizohabitans arisaemae]|uniref:SRPBCC domain-containing protein n=1 Tax=Rhizohabitans arisaemae TaxID=2720610 RepID=UPI0024B0B937|nr:SRPBCC domain-containing protein [Rhizohabitans arisaemae]